MGSSLQYELKKLSVSAALSIPRTSGCLRRFAEVDETKNSAATVELY